ncbi:hypothetical protein TrVE_jg11848 [Triparma verrucosa]|uniref:FAD/NAD(P)-binding domain-containing protein n=2 Tax=Triparma TaxID=722752 RepID=A0A9W6ZP31_9STRA|nr:hypothetical protein TrST_g5908 [Triparma strigata]GMI03462.1 hypothetical protein TrVE_jg11848 [Triparma verrucosa]
MRSYFLFSPLLLLLLSSASSSSNTAAASNPSPSKDIYDVVIVGCGPAGIQSAVYASNRNLNYIVIETHAECGSFFEHYPRKGSLISFNKVSIPEPFPHWEDGQTEDYSLKFDWHSILGQPLKFTGYTRKFYPSSATLVKYLRDVVEGSGLNVKYNVSVAEIGKLRDDSLSLSSATRSVMLSSGEVLQTKTIVLATGLVPKPPSDIDITRKRFPNATFYSYEDAPMSCEAYFKKHVVVFGNGNAGTELASWIIADCAATRTWMIGKRTLQPSHMSHYVGNVRTNNMLAMESYQLKSLDAVIEEPTIAEVLRDDLIYDSPDEQMTTIRQSLLSGDRNDTVVIHAAGFTSALNITNLGVDSTNLFKNRYPPLTAFNELVDTPNIFAAGAISHGRDYKESSGGFIHGFRYTALTTMKLIDSRLNDLPWPYRVLDAGTMQSHAVNRIQASSALWHLQAFYADLVIPVKGDSGESLFLYVEEIPTAWEMDVISRNVVKDFNRRVSPQTTASTSETTDQGSKFRENSVFVTTLGKVVTDYLLDVDENFSGSEFYMGSCAMKESLTILESFEAEEEEENSDSKIFENLNKARNPPKPVSCLEKWLSTAVIRVDDEIINVAEDEVEAMRTRLFAGQRVSINDRQNMENFETTVSAIPPYGPGRLAIVFKYGKEFKGCDAVYDDDRAGTGFITPSLYFEKDPRLTPFSGERGLKGSEFLQLWRGWDNMSENEDLFARWRRPRIVHYFLQEFVKAALGELVEPGSTYLQFQDEKGIRDYWYAVHEDAGPIVDKNYAYRHTFGKF